MPIDYKVRSAGSLVDASATGKLTEAEVRRYIKATSTDKRIKVGFDTLMDLSRASIDPKLYGLIGKFSALITKNPKKSPKSKLAIVPGSSRVFDGARQFEQISPPGLQTVIVFSDVGTARTWLGASDTKRKSP
ncbi:hypothetical protein ACFL2T_03415 [Elusimicrobiota bacterium]